MDIGKVSSYERLETDIQIGVIYLKQNRCYAAKKQFHRCVLQSQRAKQVEKSPNTRKKARDLEQKCYSIVDALEEEGEDIDVRKLLQEIDEKLDVDSPEWYHDRLAVDERTNEVVLRDRIEFLENELRRSEQTVQELYKEISQLRK